MSPLRGFVLVLLVSLPPPASYSSTTICKPGIGEGTACGIPLADGLCFAFRRQEALRGHAGEAAERGRCPAPL